MQGTEERSAEGLCSWVVLIISVSDLSISLEEIGKIILCDDSSEALKHYFSPHPVPDRSVPVPVPFTPYPE